MSKKRKKQRRYWVNIPKARAFLFKVYGLKTKEQNWYELWLVNEEVRAVFHWYHTQGTLMARYKSGYNRHKGSDQNLEALGTFGDEESVAMAIEKFKSERPELFWKKSVQIDFREGLKVIHKRVQKALQ